MKPQSFLLYYSLRGSDTTRHSLAVSAVPADIQQLYAQTPATPDILLPALEARHGREAIQQRRDLMFVAVWKSLNSTFPKDIAKAAPCLGPFSLEESAKVVFKLPLDSYDKPTRRLMREFQDAHESALKGERHFERLLSMLYGLEGTNVHTVCVDLLVAFCKV